MIGYGIGIRLFRLSRPKNSKKPSVESVAGQTDMKKANPNPNPDPTLDYSHTLLLTAYCCRL
jgi:hypothetical protein